MLGKVAIATIIGGAMPLISGTGSEAPSSITELQAVRPPATISKAYGLDVHEVPAVPKHLVTASVETKAAQPAPARQVATCPVSVRAIIAAVEEGTPFTVVEYEGNSSVLKVGDKIKAGSKSYRLSQIKIDHLILRSISKWGPRTVRCSLQ